MPTEGRFHDMLDEFATAVEVLGTIAGDRLIGTEPTTTSPDLSVPRSGIPL